MSKANAKQDFVFHYSPFVLSAVLTNSDLKRWKVDYLRKENKLRTWKVFFRIRNAKQHDEYAEHDAECIARH